jgi:hypothetical protein
MQEDQEEEVWRNGTGKTFAEWMSANGDGPRIQGAFIKKMFGEKLGGSFHCCTIQEYTQHLDNPGPDMKKFKYVVQTTFKTDGCDTQCLVFNTRKARKKDKSDTKTFRELALSARMKKKKQASVPLPEAAYFKKIIGVDLGERYAGGFVCKDVDLYDFSKQVVQYNGTIKNLVIKTAALNRPTHLFQQTMETTKLAHVST